MANPLFMAPGETKGLVTPGTIDLSQLPVAYLPSGMWGTVRSASRDVNGRELLYPTIINGIPVDDDTAFKYAMRTGKHLGIFKDGDSADVYAQRLHEDWQAGKIPGVAMPQSSQMLPGPAQPPQPQMQQVSPLVSILQQLLGHAR